MTASSLRTLALLVVLIIAGLTTLSIAFGRPTPQPPTPVPPATPLPLHTFLVDVAGWYEITPHERAVATPIDFSIQGLTELPATVGRWNGSPYDYGAAVEEWFEKPDVARSALYRDDQGHALWFSVFGSRGRKSYLLFEHTPATSYPAAGWTLVKSSIASIAMGDREMYAQQAVLTKDRERRVALYWYMWSNLERDPEAGVLTARLHIPVTSTDQDALQAGADFLRALFPQVIAWHRF